MKTKIVIYNNAGLCADICNELAPGIWGVTRTLRVELKENLRDYLLGMGFFKSDVDLAFDRCQYFQ